MTTMNVNATNSSSAPLSTVVLSRRSDLEISQGISNQHVLSLWKGDASALKKSLSTNTAMKSGAFPALFLTATFSMLLTRGLQAEEPAFVPIAWYANNDSLAKEGDRASEILRDHKIKNVCAGSTSFTLSVPAEKTQEARTLLAKAIQDDGLRINLLKTESKEDQTDNDKIVAGQDIKVLIKNIQSSRDIVVLHDGKEFRVAITGIKPAATEEQLTTAIKNLLSGNNREFILRVDAIVGNSIKGQLYSYAHLERDESTRKIILESIDKGDKSTKLR